MTYWLYLHLHPVQGWVIFALFGVLVLMVTFTIAGAKNQVAAQHFQKITEAYLNEKIKNLQELKDRGEKKD